MGRELGGQIKWTTDQVDKWGNGEEIEEEGNGGL